MSIHIYDVDCPQCGKACWVNNGDVDDQTVPDVEAVRCPWCLHEFALPGVEDETPFGRLNLTDGHKTASDAAGGR